MTFERSLDVLFLIECAAPYESLLPSFQGVPAYFPVNCASRFKVFARFAPELMERLLPPVPSDRYEIWRLQLPLQKDVLLCVVHGLDKRNNSEAKQELFLKQVVSALSYWENAVGHERSIVFG